MTSLSRLDSRATAALMMAGVMATLLVGNLLSSLSPMYIGALMENLHLSEADAGLVMTVELIAAATSLTLFSRKLVAFPPFSLAAVGTAIVLAAQLASGFAAHVPVLLCVRALSGVGASFALLAASILISRRADPDRYIAIAMVGTTLAFTGIMGICGIVVARYGLLGFYMVTAGSTLALLPLFVAIRAAPLAVAESSARSPPRPPTIVSGRGAMIIAFVVAIIGLTFIGQAAWSFAQRSGTNAGIAAVEVAGWLAGSNLLTVFGAMVAAWVSSRVTSIVPLIVGVLATGLTCAMQIGAESSWAFQVPGATERLRVRLLDPVRVRHRRPPRSQRHRRRLPQQRGPVHPSRHPAVRRRADRVQLVPVPRHRSRHRHRTCDRVDRAGLFGGQGQLSFGLRWRGCCFGLARAVPGRSAGDIPVAGWSSPTRPHIRLDQGRLERPRSTDQPSPTV